MAKDFEWHGERFKKEMRSLVDRNLDKAATFLVGRVKKSFGSAAAVAGGTTKGHRRRSRSKPGDPPHVDTGHLRRSITYRSGMSKETRDVGSFGEVKYARFLELGTRTMAPRPYLRPALDQNAQKIARIIGGKA